MSYTSFCINDYMSIKKGTVCDTYREDIGPIEYVYVNPINDMGEILHNKYLPMERNIFKKYFKYFNDYIYISYYEEEEVSDIIQFFKRKKTVKRYETEKRVDFDCDFVTLQKLYTEVIIYLLLIEDEKLLVPFGDKIIYHLESLNKIYESREIVDFDKEMLKTGQYFKEIYDIIHSIESEADDNKRKYETDVMKEFIDKYNAVTDGNIIAAQQFKKYAKIGG